MFNITNYFDHPSRPGYVVFKFSDQLRARYFEDQLKDSNIWFESSQEKNFFLFGIKKSDQKAAMRANYMASAAFRKKTVPFKFLRLFIYLIVIGGIILAIIGALKS